MNYPTQIGWQQVILFIVAVISIFLIIYFVRSIFIAEERIEKLEDEYGNKYRRRLRRRHVHWQHGFGGIILLVVAIILLGIAGAVQEYLGLTGTILVAHVRAMQAKPVNNVPMMNIELTLYNQDGSKTNLAYPSFIGDEVSLQGDIIQFPGWMNILGFHSGYKLAKLRGTYADADGNVRGKEVKLNGGDDSFFNAAFQKGWNSFFVTAAYKNASSVPPNGIGYNVCASQDALTVRPDNESC